MKEPVKVRHILLDGTVLDNISGYKVPKEHPVYDLVARIGGTDHGAGYAK